MDSVFERWAWWEVLLWGGGAVVVTFAHLRVFFGLDEPWRWLLLLF